MYSHRTKCRTAAQGRSLGSALRATLVAASVVALAAGLTASLATSLAACGRTPGGSGAGGSAASAGAAGATAAGAAAGGTSPAAASPDTSAVPAGERPVVHRGEVVPGADVVYRDLAYGDVSPLQSLDLYLPDNGDRPYPVLVAIHGGGFSGGDKRDGQVTPVLSGLTRGYAVASLDYRLSPQATFPAAINDVKAAVRWLRANSGDYGLDGSRIALWGDSAGGNLAALAGTSGDTRALRGPDPVDAGQPDAVQAIVDWFGPISFLETDADFRAAGFGNPNTTGGRSFLSDYLGAPLREVPGKVRASDPITYLSPGDPPILIEHGTRDATVPVGQSVRLASAYQRVAGKDAVTLNLLDGAGHVDPVFYSQRHLSEVLDWLDARLK